MLLKRILTLVTTQQKAKSQTVTCADDLLHPHEPQTLYERIALGNAMEDVEAHARGKWQVH